MPAPGVVIDEYMDMICWRLSVKAEGKKSGKKRWMKVKTSTWPRGESGMMRMITKGTSVTRSLRMRRSSFTSRARSVYPWSTARTSMLPASCTSCGDIREI